MEKRMTGRIEIGKGMEHTRRRSLDKHFSNHTNGNAESLESFWLATMLQGVGVRGSFCAEGPLAPNKSTEIGISLMGIELEDRCLPIIITGKRLSTRCLIAWRLIKNFCKMVFELVKESEIKRNRGGRRERETKEWETFVLFEQRRKNVECYEWNIIPSTWL